MREQELIHHFLNFLTSEKGYPRGSMLVEAPLTDTKGKFRRYVADLILLDTDFNNYLALVEFKGEGRRPSDALDQVKSYLEAIGIDNLPAYLVLPDTKGDKDVNFLVYILDENDWRQISKEDFPHYETLKSKNKADEKKEFKDLNETKRKEVKKKKELIRDTAFSTLASLIVGIVTAIILSKDIFFKSNDSTNPVAINCCDSVENRQQRINLKIATMEKLLYDMRQQDSVIKVDGRKIQISNLNTRVSAVENLISQASDRLLKIQEVTFQIQSLKTEIASEKELSDTKLTNLKERIDQVTVWTSGLIITIIGSIVGFAVNAFRKSS